MEHEPIIVAKKLSRTYEGVVPTHALKNASFEIATGEFVAIMGRSGSGKSTLLHQLSLLDTPTAGDLSIENHDVLKLPERKKSEFRLRHFGYIFQEYALIAALTAHENVFLPAMALGISPSQFKKKAEELLTVVGLGERLHHYPSELSGGEQQRVAIARSLINTPKVLYADEPCANLDTASSEVVLDLFAKLQKEFRHTIVMVTHEPEDKKYVDRVIQLEDGSIVSDERTNH